MDRLKNAGDTLREAIGLRRFVIGSSATFTLTALSAARGYLVSEWPWLDAWVPTINPAVTFAVVAGLIILFSLLQYATRLRKAAQPQVQIRFGSGNKFVGEGGELGNEVARYSFEVENMGIVVLASCKAQVRTIAYDDGQEGTHYPFSLKRSLTENEVFPLRPSDPKSIDLLRVPFGTNVSDEPARFATFAVPDPAGHILLYRPATITIQVVSERGRPPTKIFRWEKTGERWGLRLI